MFDHSVRKVRSATDYLYFVDEARNGAARNSAYIPKMKEKRSITFNLPKLLVKVVDAQSVKR